MYVYERRISNPADAYVCTRIGAVARSWYIPLDHSVLIANESNVLAVSMKGIVDAIADMNDVAIGRDPNGE